MNKIKVIIKDQNTLVLQEDAKKGDYIDLLTLQSVDTNYIQTLIKESKDNEYQKLIYAKQKEFDLEKENLTKQIQIKNNEKINELNNKISLLENELKNKENNVKQELEVNIQKFKNDSIRKESELEVKYNNDFNEMKSKLEKENASLKAELDKIKNSQQLLIENNKNDFNNRYNLLKNDYDLKIQDYKNQLKNKDDEFALKLQKEISLLKENFSKEKESLINQNNEEKELLKDNLQEKINALVEENNQLTLYKSGKNIKVTGEDLESWCDNEVNQYMQNGLFNCEWIKDNKVIKDEGELKGTKADYILKIYESEEHNYLLSSICFDMKDENILSVNKKKNKDYFNALDKNRNKKECKYAVLVSNLETDKPNDCPISKVVDPQYKDMYVVRPQYLMTFINLIVSLTTRFKDLVLEEQKVKNEFIKQEELEEMFNELKNTYLEKPLNNLQKYVDEIAKQSEAITKANDSIMNTINEINYKYIEEIAKKLGRFNLKKISKKINEFE